MVYSDNIRQIIHDINRFGGEKRPFFVLVDFEMKKPLLFPLDQINPETLLIEFENFSNSDSCSQRSNTQLISLFPLAPDMKKYAEAFQKVMYSLQRGDSYLTNLTFPVEVNLNFPAEDLFCLAKAKYKIFLRNEFLVFSPETFIKINDGMISTFPMKGTIDASIPNAETVLAEDRKELAEHYTIVDLMRNDLSLVAKEVRVKRFRYTEHIHTNNKALLQTSSEITGRLPLDWESVLGDIIFALLPAGSVSGAPKKRTCEMIRDAEAEERGYYTGIAGLYNGSTFNSCVLIRCIDLSGKKTVYRAGGGITTQSTMAGEFQELMDKVYVPLF